VNIEMNSFVGNILQSTFLACCYILLSGTRPKSQSTYTYLRRGYATLGTAGAESPLLINA